LGGDVYKIRVARDGGGKSGGYRVILFFRSGERAFYHYAYLKAARANISRKELRVFKELAKRYVSMTDEELANAVKARKFIEI